MKETLLFFAEGFFGGGGEGTTKGERGGGRGEVGLDRVGCGGVRSIRVEDSNVI
jgi:hypothetical protein